MCSRLENPQPEVACRGHGEANATNNRTDWVGIRLVPFNSHFEGLARGAEQRQGKSVNCHVRVLKLKS